MDWVGQQAANGVLEWWRNGWRDYWIDGWVDCWMLPLEGQPAGEFVAEIAGEGLVAEVFFTFEVLGKFQGVLADEPIAEAASFPFGEVLLGNRAGVEVGREEGLDLGEGVKPWQNGFGLVPIYGNDIWLHGVIGLIAVYFGWLHRDAVAATTAI